VRNADKSIGKGRFCNRDQSTGKRVGLIGGRESRRTGNATRPHGIEHTEKTLGLSLERRWVVQEERKRDMQKKSRRTMRRSRGPKRGPNRAQQRKRAATETHLSRLSSAASHATAHQDVVLISISHRIVPGDPTPASQSWRSEIWEVKPPHGPRRWRGRRSARSRALNRQLTARRWCMSARERLVPGGRRMKAGERLDVRRALLRRCDARGEPSGRER